MKKEVIAYEAVFNEFETDGIFGISLVESPATQKYFIALNEHKEIAFKVADKEKHTLTGIVLEPNVPIRRRENVGGEIEEFTITFTEDTIERLAFNFLKQNFHKNSTIEHDANQKLKGVTFVESWVVADPKNDKLNALNLESKKGAWAVTMKVDDLEIWNEYIDTGIVKGFSVDGMIQLKQINNPKPIKMSILNKLLSFTKSDKPDAVAITFGEIKMEGGEVVFEFEGETLQAGVSIFAVDATDPTNKIPVPVGEFPLEDGTTLIVTEEGKVGEIKAKEMEEVEEAPAEMSQAPTVGQTTDDAVGKANDIKSILIKYESLESKIDSIALQMSDLIAGQKELQDVKAEIAEIKKEVIEFSEAPAPTVNKQPITFAKGSTKKERLIDMVNNLNN